MANKVAHIRYTDHGTVCLYESRIHIRSVMWCKNTR